MKSPKRLLALALSATLLCMPAASLAEDATTPDTDTTVATDVSAIDTEATAEDPAEVLVTVNGVAITRAEFNDYLTDLQAYYAEYGYDTTSESLLPALREMALTTAIQFELMDEKLIELGLELTEEERASIEAEAKEQWQSVLDSGLEYMGITEESTDEERADMLLQVLSILEAQGFTEESYIRDCVDSARYNKLMDYIIKDVTVSDEAVQAEFDALVAADKEKYEGHVDQYENDQYMNQIYAAYGYTDYVVPQYYTPSGYRGISHILLTVEDELMTNYSELQATYEEQQDAIEAGETVEGELVTLEQLDAAKQAIIASVQPTIDEIHQKLSEGITFDALIQQYGTDPGMQDDTTRAEGYSVHMDSINWDPAFTAGAFTVDNVGDVTEPIVGSYGVHILQYVRDVPAGAVELTDALKESLRADLLLTAQNTLYNDTVAQWEAEATIVYSDAGLDIMPASVDNAE